MNILFEVGVSALIDLANAEFWVMAFQLMDWVKILAPEEPKTAFVLISAEIYLANNDPVEALYLLQSELFPVSFYCNLLVAAKTLTLKKNLM